MKTYCAGTQLESILICNGLIETTSEGLRQRGKKTFSISKSSEREIYISNDKIELMKFRVIEDSGTEFNEAELRMLIFYFKFKTNAITELTPKGFKISDAVRGISSLRTELQNIKANNGSKIRRGKIERIINAYDEIKLK